MAELVTKLKERGVTSAVETQGSRWQNWLKDIDQVTLSPKPPSSKMEVNFETLDFIVSQLDPDKVTFKIPVFDDADLAFAKGIQERYQPDVLFLSAGNPEPKATGNIVQDQLDRLKELWERVAADDSWGNVRVLPQLHTLLSTINVVFKIRKKKIMSQQEEMKNLSLLGNKETNYIFDYQPEVLESFDNRHVENDYFIKFNCPEFTSLCPITAQPDFCDHLYFLHS